MNLTIAGAKVRMDGEGRYSLNDLHKASGAEKRHGPAYWLANEQTQGLINALAQEMGDAGNPVSVVRGGNAQGTFVCKELVYAYGMWIAPEFHLRVIRAFDALVNGNLEEAQRIASRNNARMEAICLTDAVVHHRKVQGKPVAHYHFSNEFDLINRVALGRTAKDYRADHGLTKDEPIRDHLTKMEIRCIEHLQRANATMIDLGFDYEKRKTELNRLYVTRHSAALLAEVKRIEA